MLYTPCRIEWSASYAYRKLCGYVLEVSLCLFVSLTKTQSIATVEPDMIDVRRGKQKWGDPLCLRHAEHHRSGPGHSSSESEIGSPGECQRVNSCIHSSSESENERRCRGELFGR